MSGEKAESSHSKARSDVLQLTKDGDVLLVLDSGEAHPAHSLYLKHKSTVLGEAIALGRPEEGVLRVPVPGTTDEELLQLLQAIYTQESSYLDNLDITGLWALARVSHRLGCHLFSGQADVVLARVCAPAAGANGNLAWQWLDLSQQLHLEATEAKLTTFITTCTYFRWIADDRHNAQRVIGLRLPYRVVNRFLRFRTGCHGLPSDVGAHQGVPRERRFCTLCRQGVGDELHLVFECAALQDLRAQMPGIFLGVTTMRGFMQQRDIRSVATFISTAVKRVQDMT